MKYGLFMLLFLPVWASLAAPVVIFDAGDTQSMAPYYEAITPQQKSAQSIAQRKRRQTRWQPPADDFFLPVRTPELTPGTVARRAVKREPRFPFFVLGADRLSLQWLTEYYDQLVAMGAVGLLVQVETLREVKAIGQMAPELKILPVSGTYLAQNLGLKHYPVLISREGLEQ